VGIADLLAAQQLLRCPRGAKQDSGFTRESKAREFISRPSKEQLAELEKLPPSSAKPWLKAAEDQSRCCQKKFRFSRSSSRTWRRLAAEGP